MNHRIDYYDDPTAPTANSLVPSVNVAVTNDAGELLLIRRTDNGNWALPGGAIDLGESIAQAAVRETREETGIVCEITGLVGIYSDPRHVIHYTSNDEVRQEFSIVLTGRRAAVVALLLPTRPARPPRQGGAPGQIGQGLGEVGDAGGVLPCPVRPTGTRRKAGRSGMMVSGVGAASLGCRAW